jgi:GDP-mannose 6-dehydrogenase
MVKYVDNSFHALKVTFANEIGTICKSLEIDSHEVMNIFCQDTKLNLSPLYFKPGFSFGGSCLPKDLRGLNYLTRHNDLNLPVLDAILHSNKLHIEYALQLVAQTEKKKVGILGLAFKAGTDDLRESPIVALIETLIGKGYQVQIYDKNVSYSMLRGSNRKYIEDKIPHIASLLCKNLEDIVEMAEVIIIGNRNAEFVNIFSEADRSQVIIDLVRISEECNTEAVYQGICW